MTVKIECQEYIRAKNAVTFARQQGYSIGVALSVLRFVCRKYGIAR